MNKSISFAGQPILSQILDVIPSSLISRANRKHQSNRYYKKLPLRTHLVSLLYGVFSYCNGLRELCEGLLGCEGKLSHLGSGGLVGPGISFTLAGCFLGWDMGLIGVKYYFEAWVWASTNQSHLSIPRETSVKRSALSASSSSVT